MTARIVDGRATDELKELSSTHPFVVTVESSLEAFAPATLDLTVAGLGKSTMEALTSARRELQGVEGSDELQSLLFAFEEVCDDVRHSSYGGISADEAHEFFAESFPEWLDALRAWAGVERHEQLEQAAATAHSGYLALPRSWWTT